jgi:hypothetical protein
MNAISKFGWLALSMAITATAIAAPAPYENAVSKAMHPGKPHIARTYVQPRVYVQPRMMEAPRVAITPAPEARRTFSYEPATPVIAAPRRTYSYQPAAPVYVAPRAGRVMHTYESATLKGSGQIR